MKTQNLVSDVLIPHKGNLKWRICETGAGCPVASTILNTAGASAIIYDTHVPYSKESQEDAGYMINTPRSISSDFCAKVIARKSANMNANAIFVSSFQVGEDRCTHGWIGISYPSFTRYYHITLGVGVDRTRAIRRIGDIGVILMCKALGETVVEPLEIDSVLDESFTPIWEELIVSDNEYAFLIDKSEYVQRLEVMRDLGNIIVFPGSFNPLHDGHKEMMAATGAWIQANGDSDFEVEHQGLYCITMRNVDESKNPKVESILGRLPLLLEDHDVLITNSPGFKDFAKLHKRLGNVTIHVPVGWDTFGRMEDELLSEKFNFITWHIFDRDNVIKNCRESGSVQGKQIIRNLEANACVVLHENREHMTMSSTEIRNNAK